MLDFCAGPLGIGGMMTPTSTTTKRQTLSLKQKIIYIHTQTTHPYIQLCTYYIYTFWILIIYIHTQTTHPYIQLYIYISICFWSFYFALIIQKAIQNSLSPKHSYMHKVLWTWWKLSINTISSKLLIKCTHN